MTDALILILVVVSIYLGVKSHNPRLTPYIASLALGILVAVGLHKVLAKYINTQTQLDYAFSSIISFTFLVLLGAIVFYAGILLFYHFNEKQASKIYSSFSKGNYISFPILVAAVLCIIATVFAELPLRSRTASIIQTNILHAKTVKAFTGVIQKSGIESELITALKKVPLSNGESSEDVIPLSFKSDTISYDQRLELEMTKLINAERTNTGIKPLEYKSDLADVARNHSIDMLKRRYFSHINLDGKSPFTRLHDADIGYTTAGENLAVSTSLQGAVTALMQSPTHKANILNDKFSKTGIGIAINQDGIMAMSEEFTN